MSVSYSVFEWMGLWAGSVWTFLLFCIMMVLHAKFPSRKKRKTKNWNDLNCTECGGPLISMLFLPSVNFDYGEMPVMAFLSFSHFLWLRGVGGVEVLIGNCRAHCLHIHGFLDWPASGSERHNRLQTHKCAHTQVILTHNMYPYLWAMCIYSNQANQHLTTTLMFRTRMLKYAAHPPPRGTDQLVSMRKI